MHGKLISGRVLLALCLLFFGVLHLPGSGVAQTASAALIVSPEARTAGVAQDVVAAARRRPARGALALRIGGLPRAAHASVLVIGPRQSRDSRRRYRRLLTGVGAVRLKGLREGVYGIAVRKVRLRRGAGAIERGAVALPVRRQLRVRVRGNRSRTIAVRYGSIVNPGVRSVAGLVRSVLGGR